MAVELITLGSVIRDALDTTLGHSNWQVDVTGDGYITVTGTPSSNQLAVFSDPTTVQGVSGLTWNGTEFTITGDLDVTANGSIGGGFVVTGSATLNDSLVVGTNTTIGGDLVASGNITAGGDLAVSGILSVNGLATFTDNVVMSSSLNISNNLSIAGNITAGGDLAVSGAFNATDVALFDADVTLLANLDVSGDITVDGTVDGVDIAQLANDVAALANGMVYAGNWDASGGSFPGAGGAQTGAFYTVSVGGTVDGEAFEAGDRLIAIVDNASTTTYAANWTRLDATDAVQSVAGLVGTITDAALRTALNVEDGATADQTGAEIKAAYEAEADTNAFTDAEQSKLAGIEDNATADQTGAEIVSLLDTELGSSDWQSGGGVAISITEKTADYDVADADLAGGHYHEANHATSMTITVPSGLTGTEPLTVERTAAGTVTFAAGAGVTINSRDGLLDIGGQYGAVTLIPKGDDAYTLIGDLA